MKKLTGKCLCGDVTYTVTSKPLVTRACWCNLCQTLASGNATINLAFNKASFKVVGELSDFQSVADSGNIMHRKFCVKCGTHLFSEADERPNIIVIRAGTLEDSDNIKVEGIIWTSEAPSWARLDPDVPHFSHQPPAPSIVHGDRS